MRNTVSLKPGCTPLLMLFDIVILSKKFARLEISKKLWLVIAHRNVTALREQTLATRPLGSFQPAMVSTIATSYVRDPAVKAWVLQVANGRCEGCDAPAPFMGGDGLPYLEVHHVMPLSSHGSDTTANAAALCPNCHRRCHSSIDRDEFKLALYQKIARLIVEVPALD